MWKTDKELCFPPDRLCLRSTVHRFGECCGGVLAPQIRRNIWKIAKPLCVHRFSQPEVRVVGRMKEGYSPRPQES